MAELFAKEIEEKAKIIDDEEFIEIFEDLIMICKKLIKGQMPEESPRNDIVEQFEIVKEYYSFLCKIDINEFLGKTSCICLLQVCRISLVDFSFKTYIN